MTLENLQRIVLGLANSSHCRYWVHWNYPQNPIQMAIQIVDYTGPDTLKPFVVKDLESAGFVRWNEETIFYIIDRTTEDGKPYHSKI